MDVIISNCVIDLSPDKSQVMSEAYHVLKPGGKLAVSDIVTDGPLPDEVKPSLSSWAGCVTGALDGKDYMAASSGMPASPMLISLRCTCHREAVDEALESLDAGLPRPGFRSEHLYQTVFSARITARKPE